MQMGHQATESFWSELNNVTHFPQHGSALQINFFRKFGKFHMAVRCQKKNFYFSGQKYLPTSKTEPVNKLLDYTGESLAHNL